MHFVIYEDRPGHQIGVKIALLSLHERVPGSTVRLLLPGAPEGLRRWCSRWDGVEVDVSPVAGVGGWDVKPLLLLQELERHPVVLWMDSDIVVSGDLRGRLRQAPGGALVATEETYWGQHQGGTHRATAWGLSPGRSLASTVNSGLLRVDRNHSTLLRAWQHLLADDTYITAQRQPWRERPIHLLGDQEVLTALLGSAEHSGVHLHLLRQGRDIAQCFGPAGYTPVDRVVAAVSPGRRPVLVHAMGRKPWETPPASPGLLARARSLHHDLHQRWSPYTAVAARYADDLGEPCPWLGTERGPVRAQLQELPLAVVDHTARWARARLGVGRYQVVR